MKLLVLVYYWLVGIISFCCFVYVLTNPPKPQIPCTVAEISPDFSTQDREHCRRLRAHKM
jgi:hypothetical protein